MLGIIKVIPKSTQCFLMCVYDTSVICTIEAFIWTERETERSVLKRKKGEKAKKKVPRTEIDYMLFFTTRKN